MSEPHYNWNGGGFCSICVVDDGTGHAGSAPWPCEVVRARATVLAELRAKVEALSDADVHDFDDYPVAGYVWKEDVLALLDPEKP